MKRQTILRAGFVAVLFGVIFYANIPSTLFTIFVIGIIPGTSITIPAWLMLLMYPSLFALMLYWLGKQSLLIGERPSKKPVRPLKKSVPTALRKTRRRNTAHVAKRRARAAV